MFMAIKEGLSICMYIRLESQQITKTIGAMMMRLLDLSWFFLLLLSVSLSTPAPVNEEPSIEDDEQEMQGVADPGSPQFLYMQMLQERLKDSTKTLSKNSATPGGALLATSIEADSIAGPGDVENGFEFQQGNEFTIEFTIPRQKEATVIQNTELWLFPLQQFQATYEEGTIIEMTLLVVINLAHAKQPRREVMDITWNTNMGCIPLDTTSLSKKISKNLQKRDLEQANITVSIEVVRINSHASQLSDPISNSYVDICNTLAEKTSSTPFLVVKYYSDEPFSSFMSSGISQLPDSEKEKRDINSLPTPDSGKNMNCSVVPLIVDLTEVYGTFIVKPQRLDISDCYGSCNVFQNSHSFSLHATILERLKLLKGGDIKRNVCCTPIEYKPQGLLIYQQHYFVLVEFPNMIVTKCACH